MLPGVDIGQPTRQVIVRDQARALAENRLAAARHSPYDDLVHLPDSLARGRFDPPFEMYEWNATSREVRRRCDPARYQRPRRFSVRMTRDELDLST
jgi:hypothetical protein